MGIMNLIPKTAYHDDLHVRDGLRHNNFRQGLFLRAIREFLFWRIKWATILGPKTLNWTINLQKFWFTDF